MARDTLLARRSCPNARVGLAHGCTLERVSTPKGAREALQALPRNKNQSVVPRRRAATHCRGRVAEVCARYGAARPNKVGLLRAKPHHSTNFSRLHPLLYNANSWASSPARPRGSNSYASEVAAQNPRQPRLAPPATTADPSKPPEQQLTSVPSGTSFPTQSWPRTRTEQATPLLGACDDRGSIPPPCAQHYFASTTVTPPVTFAPPRAHQDVPRRPLDEPRRSSKKYAQDYSH